MERMDPLDPLHPFRRGDVILVSSTLSKYNGCFGYVYWLFYNINKVGVVVESAGEKRKFVRYNVGSLVHASTDTVQRRSENGKRRFYRMVWDCLAWFDQPHTMDDFDIIVPEDVASDDLVLPA